MKEMYYPCVFHKNELYVLASDGIFHKLNTSLKWVGWKRYERAKQEAMKVSKTYKVLVLSDSEIKELFNKVYDNDDIYFDADKRKAVCEIIKDKLLN